VRLVFGKRFGTGTRLVVGPVRSDNFPFVLLDRAIGLVAELLKRTHARRDQLRLAAAELMASLDGAKASTEFWPPELRKLCLTFARNARDGKRPVELEHEFHEKIAAQLRTISDRLDR
jgi:hypothetical protein